MTKEDALLVVDNETHQIIGKGHNTLVQENDPYNHRETAAIRNAGRKDFSKTIIFTTLSPYDVCAILICMRQFKRVIVGNITSASGNEDMLRKKGVQVDILEDLMEIALYEKYRTEKPKQEERFDRSIKKIIRITIIFQKTQNVTQN